jgi:methylated-DNA-[protein]-cysteine S-methyltransferase
MTHPITTSVDSPVGTLTLTASEGYLTAMSMDGQKHAPDPVPDSRVDPAWFTEIIGQLDAYFAGALTQFDIPVKLDGTEFQRRVWSELQAIPYGETISYGELARRVGSPKASRAVGLANGRNPVTIIVPCHRVIGSNGKLTGYGGGLDRKTWLLDHEAANLSGGR